VWLEASAHWKKCCRLIRSGWPTYRATNARLALVGVEQALDDLLRADRLLKSTPLSDVQVLEELLPAARARARLPHEEPSASPAARTRASAQRAAARAERVDSLIALGRVRDARVAPEWQRAGESAGKVDGGQRARGLYLAARLTENAADAQEKYLNVALSYPTSREAPEALLRLGQALIAAGDAGRAATYFDRVIRDYSKAPARADAYLWLTRAQLSVATRGLPVQPQPRAQSGPQRNCANRSLSKRNSRVHRLQRQTTGRRPPSLQHPRCRRRSPRRPHDPPLVTPFNSLLFARQRMRVRLPSSCVVPASMRALPTSKEVRSRVYASVASKRVNMHTRKQTV
jgi:tetratricopeptide (TPR) repeat protein